MTLSLDQLYSVEWEVYTETWTGKDTVEGGQYRGEISISSQLRKT
jgi:hypothetical protein